MKQIVYWSSVAVLGLTFAWACSPTGEKKDTGNDDKEPASETDDGFDDGNGDGDGDGDGNGNGNGQGNGNGTGSGVGGAGGGDAGGLGGDDGGLGGAYSVGCVEDAMCTLDDDCVCADCDADEYCSDPANCTDDGVCDPYTEGCVCADCASHPECQ